MERGTPVWPDRPSRIAQAIGLVGIDIRICRRYTRSDSNRLLMAWISAASGDGPFVSGDIQGRSVDDGVRASTWRARPASRWRRSRGCWRARTIRSRRRPASASWPLRKQPQVPAEPPRPESARWALQRHRRLRHHVQQPDLGVDSRRDHALRLPAANRQVQTVSTFLTRRKSRACCGSSSPRSASRAS